MGSHGGRVGEGEGERAGRGSRVAACDRSSVSNWASSNWASSNWASSNYAIKQLRDQQLREQQLGDQAIDYASTCICWSESCSVRACRQPSRLPLHAGAQTGSASAIAALMSSTCCCTKGRCACGVAHVGRGR
eukprot:506501-Prymnesium_polylepis.1